MWAYMKILLGVYILTKLGESIISKGKDWSSSSSSSKNPDWACLPNDLLASILDRLYPLSDYIRFSAVCKSWLSVAMDQRQSRLKSCNRQLPLLMIPTKDKNIRSLYNVIKHKVIYRNDAYNKLCIPYNQNWCGSSYGWLATVVAKHNDNIMQINLFTGRHTIHLPPVYIVTQRHTLPLPPVYIKCPRSVALHPRFFKKVILSGNPSIDDNYIVAASFVGGLAYFRSGSKCWTYVDLSYINIDDISDLTFHKGELYALLRHPEVDDHCLVTLIKFGSLSNNTASHTTELAVEVPTYKGSCLWPHIYLVESSSSHDGEKYLLMVVRIVAIFVADRIGYATREFKVYKKVNDEDDCGQHTIKWVEINCLGDAALFVGEKQSMSIPASNFPGCQPNSIYYTGEQVANHDEYVMGIFNLKDKSIRRLYKLSYAHRFNAHCYWIFSSFNLPSIA